MRKNHEKYIALRSFFLTQEEERDIDIEFLNHSTEEIIPDIANPTIKIRRYQYDILKNKTKFWEAARFLIDILFEKEELKGQNFTKLTKSNPDKVFVICNYIKKVFKCKDSELHKTCIDKCYE